MDGIVPFRENPTSVQPTVGRHTLPLISTHPATNPATVKTLSDYLGAMRRRVWLILVVAVPLAIAGAVWTMRQPRIYQAVAEVTIDPPQYDPVLSTLVSHDIGRHDTHAQESYIPNLTAILKSKNLAELVVSKPALKSEVTQYDDPAVELIISRLQVRPYPKTNMILVTLEGKDPARTKKLLEILLNEFKDIAEIDTRKRVDITQEYAKERLEGLKKNLASLERDIIEHLQKERTIGPGGKNIFEEQYVHMENLLEHRQMQLGELNQQLMIAQNFPKPDLHGDTTSRQQRIEILEKEKRKWINVLQKVRRTARRFDNDPAAREYGHRLEEIMDEIQELKSLKTEMAENPTSMILEQCSREFKAEQARHEALAAKMQESMPAHQKYLALVKESDQARQAVADMDRNISAFEILAKTQHDWVKIPPSVVEPTIPIRPSRVLYIAMDLIMSLGMGIGLVFLLEHVDHSIKVPEHVTQGLTLPLLGVVPRIRRTALTHRGGHLWTHGTTDSISADAFRNIRASLLGIADRRGPIVTLLVTSPKSGDGKSTAALNLAATCARAGERTLLLDVDLRRPTLDLVFPGEPGKEGAALGLVDVLQGTLPWQKTLRRTELRNLDFIPTGNPHEIPIEILGTLELRQLLTALSSHYDRVILDGPAVLGMADCRMLGRMVDTSLLVIRSGVHQLVTLQRAKAMLEQSHVNIAGVIVNSLSEDLHNWSSYGYESGLTAIAGSERRAIRQNVLRGSESRPDALVPAGSNNTSNYT